MAKKRKRVSRSEPSTKCFSLGATVGHMMALSGEAIHALKSGDQLQARQAFDYIEHEAKEFGRLMGKRLDPDHREASKRIQETSKTIVKELKPSSVDPLAVDKRAPLGKKALEMLHDVRSLLEAGNSACGNFPEAQLRSKPFPKGK